MLAFALRADGWYLRQDIIWSKPNPMPESVTDRCTKSHEYIFLLSKSKRYFCNMETIKEDSITQDIRKPYAPGQVDVRGNGHDRGGGTIRKTKIPGGWDRGEGAHGTIHRNGRTSAEYQEVAVSEKRNKRSVWTVGTEPFPEAHFATFPTELIKPCILAGCPPGGTVLDPFAGSLTTMQVARDLSCKSIGIELNPEYIDIGLRCRLQQHVLDFSK
jgi:DNA modification methylase